MMPTDEQRKALEVAADTLIERFAAPIRALLSASEPAASMSVAQRDSIWVAAEAMEKIDQHVHASELRAMLAASPAAGSE